MEKVKDLTKEIQVLFVEDMPRDAELVNQALRENGLIVRSQRVETKDAFLLALEQRPPDVILSDHGLPEFSGFAALAIARKNYPEIPFIFVTDALTPEMEIEKLAPGATDLVPKRELSKLAFVIRRALTEPKLRRRLTEDEREGVIKKLLGLLASYEMDGVYIPICSCCKSIRDKNGEWRPPESYFRKHLELKFTHSICPKCLPDYLR